jgi:hypothetical protein
MGLLMRGCGIKLSDTTRLNSINIKKYQQHKLAHQPMPYWFLYTKQSVSLTLKKLSWTRHAWLAHDAERQRMRMSACLCLHVRSLCIRMYKFCVCPFIYTYKMIIYEYMSSWRTTTLSWRGGVCIPWHRELCWWERTLLVGTSKPDRSKGRG